MALRGKVAFVTGAAGGIGGAVVQAFEEAGATVFGVDLKASETIHGADLTRAVEVERAVRACIEHHGRLDIAFNGMGISGRRFGDGPVDVCTEEGWDVTLTTNLKSIFLCCKHEIPELRRAGGGAIVNLSSTVALVGGDADFATHAYAASKGGIVSLTRAMGTTYAAEGIRCNVICPGLVRTPMSRRAQQDERILARLPELLPLGGDFLEPEDVAAAAVFLASPAAARITGVVLPVDAGWTAR